MDFMKYCHRPDKTCYNNKKQRSESMLFICYPKCSTCLKAEKYLQTQNLEYTKRDIKTDNPNAEELHSWQQASGLPLKKFFNTSGLQYKALGLKDKLPQLSEEEQLQLLATDGMLVKRPLLITDDAVLVGFKEAEWSEKLQQK
jgi:arsenate reductase